MEIIDELHGCTAIQRRLYFKEEDTVNGRLLSRAEHEQLAGRMRPTRREMGSPG
jgi:hypothetical protein